MVHAAKMADVTIPQGFVNVKDIFMAKHANVILK